MMSQHGTHMRAVYSPVGFYGDKGRLKKTLRPERKEAWSRLHSNELATHLPPPESMSGTVVSRLALVKLFQ